MKSKRKTNRASGALGLGVAAALVLLAAGNAAAQARIEGISGQTSFAFTAKAGEVSTPEGGSLHFWGYEDLDETTKTAPTPAGWRFAAVPRTDPDPQPGRHCDHHSGKRAALRSVRSIIFPATR